MGLKQQLRIDDDTQVSLLKDVFELMAAEFVLRMMAVAWKRVVNLLSQCQHYAFASMELHEPCVGPVFKSLKVALQCRLIG